MKGAKEYAELFETGQNGKLYIVSHYNARGKTFRIWVLPEGELALPDGDNPPLNNNAVEVYGITGGQPGWSETYGWLHKGKWIQDFEEMVEERKQALLQDKINEELETKLVKEHNVKQRIKDLLSKY